MRCGHGPQREQRSEEGEKRNENQGGIEFDSRDFNQKSVLFVLTLRPALGLSRRNYAALQKASLSGSSICRAMNRAPAAIIGSADAGLTHQPRCIIALPNLSSLKAAIGSN